MHTVNPCIFLTIKLIMLIASPNFCVGLWFLSHVTFWLMKNHNLEGVNEDVCERKISFQKETLCSNLLREKYYAYHKINRKSHLNSKPSI